MPLSILKSTAGTYKPQVQQQAQSVQQTQKPNLFDFTQQSSAKQNVMGLISSIPQPKQTYQKRYFSDEKQIVDDMISKGYTEDIARKTIENRRKDLLKVTKLTPNESQMLIKMADDGLDTQTALEGLNQYRKDNFDKWYSELPLYKKIGKTVFDIGARNIAGAVGEVSGIANWISGGTIGQSGMEARDYARQTFQAPGAGFGEVIGAGAIDTAAGYGAGKVLGAGAKFNALSPTKQLITGGAGYGALSQIGEKGAEATMGDIATGAGIGAVGGLALGKVAVPAITKTVQKGMKYGTAGLKGGITGVKRSISRDINNAFSGQKLAGAISTKANRFRAGINKNPTEEFTKKFGQTPGEFAVSRGMTKTGDDAVMEATKLYKQSMNEANKAFEAIPTKITKGVNKQGKDVLKPVIDDLYDRLKYVDSPDLPKIVKYKQLYNSGEGLTMTDINDIKRLYSSNFKYTVLDNVGKDALRSANLQNNLREWQFDTAKKFGLTNIREINKNTQAWRMFADELAKNLKRTAGNNAISLTDWVALSGGEPTNIALFLGKKAVQSEYIKRGAIKVLGKKTTEPIIKATNLQPKGKTNVTNNNILRNRSSTSTKSTKVNKIIKQEIKKEVKKEVQAEKAKIKSMKKKPTKITPKIDTNKKVGDNKTILKSNTKNMNKSGFINPTAIGQDIKKAGQAIKKIVTSRNPNKPYSNLKGSINNEIQIKKDFIKKIDNMRNDDRIEYFYDNPSIEKQYNKYKKDISIFNIPMNRAETGKPIQEKLYHGTNMDFKKINSKYANKSSGTGVGKNHLFFTDNKDVALSYGKNIKEQKVSLKNPLVIDAEGQPWNDIKYKGESKNINNIAILAEKQGYDGLIVKNIRDTGGYSDKPAGFTTSTSIAVFNKSKPILSPKK